MSMIDNDEPSSAECAVCPVIAFDPKPCAVCGPFAGRLCSDCRKHCAECGEDVCFDCWNEKAETCKTCERQRMVESGEALAEWKEWENA